MSYRKKSASVIAAILDAQPKDATVPELRKAVSAQAPIYGNASRFRIFYEEAKKAIDKRIKSRPGTPAAGNLFGLK